MTQVRTGILLGCCAILLWSTSSAGTLWTAKRIGAWQFLAMSCAIGGLSQLLFYWRKGFTMRQIFLPPARLWAMILLCFVLYMIVYTQALVLATSDTQKAGVSLANYLWPTLTVLFVVLLVPGTKLTARLILAVLISLAGLVLANWSDLRNLLSNQSDLSILPYLLGLLAAVSWSIYCALLARWSELARGHATALLGFLATAAIAAVVCTVRREWQWDPPSMIGVVFVGLGVEGLGYLLWERALHKAPASLLGLLGSATPVLSTFWLLALFAAQPTAGSKANVPVLVVSAAMIGCAVLLGTVKPKR